MNLVTLFEPHEVYFLYCLFNFNRYSLKKQTMSLIGVRSKSFRLPAKKKNALKFFNLTMDLGTQAVRLYFDSIVPPNKLAGHLAAPTHETKLRNLIKKKILKKCHEDILFSTTSKFRMKLWLK